MSGKSNKLNEVKVVEVGNLSALELSALVGTILDYYEATEGEILDSGEEWKRLSEDENISKGISVPEELDDELRKTFIAQVKKFQ